MIIRKRVLILVLLLIGSIALYSQNIGINEVMSSNANISRNEDGETRVKSNSSQGLQNETTEVKSLSEPPAFSINGGLYSKIFSVVLTSDSPNTKIYYSLDGSEPTQNSLLYFKPIAVNLTKVIRAIAIENNFAPSKVITQTYFIDLNTKLPVLSLSTNPSNFFDPDSGIYVMGKNASPDFPYFGANFWRDWERPIHIELYEPDGKLGFSTDAGVKIYGTYSRGNDQKSLAIFARKEYGNKEIDYPIFPNYSVKKFKSIVLRNGGNDWDYSLMRDGLMQNLVKDLDLETQAFRPSLLFLNGEFWGIYNIREKVNEDFLESHSGYDKDSIDILEKGGEIVEGDSANYMAMLNYISNHDLSNPQNYSFIKNWMDIDEYINYMAAEIYFDNTDWPGNNVKLWRPRKQDAKWRWILYDTDFGFGLFDNSGYKHNTIAFATVTNGPDWPNPDWSTFLFRNLLKNTEFRNNFLSRIADLMNYNFKASRVDAMIDSLKNIIEPELPRQNQRWGDRWSNFSNEIKLLKDFAEKRIVYLRAYLTQQFDLPEMHSISFYSLPVSGGSIIINNTRISTLSMEWILF